MPTLQAVKSAREYLRKTASNKAEFFRKRDAFAASRLEISCQNIASTGETEVIADVAHHAPKFGTLREGQDLVVGTGLENCFSEGWHNVEDWGVWSGAKAANISIRVSTWITFPFILEMDLKAFVPRNTTQNVSIYGGNRILSRRDFSDDLPATIELVILPTDVTQELRIDLKIEVTQLLSPKDTFGADDYRMLGVALTALRYKQIEESAELLARQACILRAISSLVCELNIFDSEWYLSRYSDVRRANVDPIEHYKQSGATEGRFPSRTFNPPAFTGGLCIEYIHHLVYYCLFEPERLSKIKSRRGTFFEKLIVGLRYQAHIFFSHKS